jgi:hypothetical protein
MRPMDVWEARAVLEVADDDGWEAIRASYRRLIRVAHPDAAGPAGSAGANRAAARLNAAYAVLSRAKRAGTLDAPRPAPARGPSPGAGAPAGRGNGWGPAPPPAPEPAWAPPLVPRAGVAVVGTDTLLLAAPPDEAFARLLEAAHRVGAVTYVDRSCAIFELVVQVDGESCSLVVTLQGRAHGTEAFVTLESLERVATHSPEPLLHLFARALA